MSAGSTNDAPEGAESPALLDAAEIERTVTAALLDFHDVPAHAPIDEHVACAKQILAELARAGFQVVRR